MTPPTASSLTRFQDAFAQALLAPETVTLPEVARLTTQPAFAVYRNTMVKGCIDALLTNYPAVSRLVGDEWMRAAAAIYVGQTRPSDPALLRYGSDFEAFLTTFEPVVEMPYLPGVAHLDRLWREVHAAPDAYAMTPAAMAQVSTGALAYTVLPPHAATRWAWFGEAPIYTIWSRNRREAPFDADIPWHAEGALLTRPDDAVIWTEIDAAGCAFLDACATGNNLGAAAQAALDVKPDVDLANLMSRLLTSGALGRPLPVAE